MPCEINTLFHLWNKVFISRLQCKREKWPFITTNYETRKFLCIFVTTMYLLLILEIFMYSYSNNFFILNILFLIVKSYRSPLYQVNSLHLNQIIRFYLLSCCFYYVPWNVIRSSFCTCILELRILCCTVCCSSVNALLYIPKLRLFDLIPFRIHRKLTKWHSQVFSSSYFMKRISCHDQFVLRSQICTSFMSQSNVLRQLFQISW